MAIPQLTIYPKFKTLLRPLNDDERQRLEWSILKEGILDPIKYWVHEDGTAYIIDGHNRFDIYQKYASDIPGGYQAIELRFKSEEEVLEWILENQLRRRNLNQNERVLYLGQLFEMRKKRRGGLSKTDVAGATAEQIANEQDVSPRTVTRAAEVAVAYSEADQDMQKKFAAGEISQAELLRAIKKQHEVKELKKDRLRNERTLALSAVGERLGRTIKALRNHAEDYQEVCRALKLDPFQIAPGLAVLTKQLVQEEAEAEALTTVVYVNGLCPETSDVCKICKRVSYMTMAQLEKLRSHFKLESEGIAKSA